MPQTERISHGASLTDKVAFLQSRGVHGFETLPGHMVQGVCDYIIFGLPPGGFLTAVLSNDLKMAFGRADEQNQHAMRRWVMFMYNEMPSQAQGSPEKVDEWMAHGGLCGKREEDAG